MSAKKLKLGAFILMILTSVFGVTNIGIGFYRMGYAAIPMFVVGGLFFFIPFILMMIANSTSKCDTRLCRLTVLFEYLDRLPESETFPRS